MKSKEYNLDESKIDQELYEKLLATIKTHYKDKESKQTLECVISTVGVLYVHLQDGYINQTTIN